MEKKKLTREEFQELMELLENSKKTMSMDLDNPQVLKLFSIMPVNFLKDILEDSIKKENYEVCETLNNLIKEKENVEV